MMDYASDVTELDNFSFYGGGVLDLILGGGIYDIDLAIKGISDEQINKLNQTFEKKGFKVVHPKRYYPISNDEIEVYLSYAKNENYFFDVAYIDDPSQFGLFNLYSSFALRRGATTRGSC